jgi:hypothetical protein
MAQDTRCTLALVRAHPRIATLGLRFRARGAQVRIRIAADSIRGCSRGSYGGQGCW